MCLELKVATTFYWSTHFALEQSKNIERGTVGYIRQARIMKRQEAQALNYTLWLYSYKSVFCAHVTDHCITLLK